jgi:hypothetical protein
MIRLGWCKFAAVCLAACFACARPSLPGRAEAPQLRIEPPEGADGAAEVLRIHVSALDAAPGSIALFRGVLDSYHVARIRASALPSTLEDQRVAGTTWAVRARESEPAEWVFAPVQRLVAGETYSVGVLGYGAVGSFVVRPQPADYAARLWPPSFAPKGGKRWVFCGTGPMPPPGAVVDLEPASLVAVVAAGADSFETSSDRCFRLELRDSLAGTVDASVRDADAAATSQVAGAPLAVPPPMLEGLALDPSPVVMDPPAESDAAPECVAGSVAIGPGCARVLDDRFFLRTAGEPLLWALLGPATDVVAAARPDEELMVGGLSPSTQITLRGTATDLGGNETAFSAILMTRPAQAHLVLNEVLANPNGADRTAEWVELVNDGATDVDTAGWSLEDANGGSPLPRAKVPAGAYALIVPEGYDAASAADVAPVAGTLILRVHQLVSGGLSNQGEELRLRDATGAVVSQFPALVASRSGVSMARRAPTSADDDSTAFGPSAPPGASPGAANVLVE